MSTSARAALLDVRRHGARGSIIGPGVALDGPALARAIARASAGLRARGIRAGDRVAVLGSTAPTTAIAILAAIDGGAVAVPLNPRYREAELAHVVRDSGAALAVVDAALADRLATAVPELERVDVDTLAHEPTDETLAPADDDAPAVIVYTSGTTGPSKGVELSLRAIVENARAVGGLWGLCAGDVLVLALPLFHVHGLCVGLAGALVHGTAVRMHPRFDAAAIVRDFAEHGATVFMGVPTMYVQLLEHLARVPGDAAALAGARLFTAGSAALSESVHARFEALTGQRILERYGMTETLITLSNPLVGERRPGSVGKPIAGAEIRIVDDDTRDVASGDAGELLVRAPWLMRGYHGAPAATADAFSEGWFRTGDVAIRDGDGYVRIVGRTSTDIVKTGGFKVATREIEDAIAEVEGVAEVAVVGVPDERWGERIVAAVVATPHVDATALSEAVVAHVRMRLADYKTPREVRIVAELPKTAMGKVEKVRLRSGW
jgi:acyl-CoA synthetase (AMP-forming)/AMP-acid ligase II